MEASQTRNQPKGRSRLNKVEVKKIKKVKVSKRNWLNYFLTFLFFLLIIFLMFRFNPKQIADFLIPQSYLPLIILVMFFTFFLAKSFRIHSRLAYSISLSLASLLFFKLQTIHFNLFILLLATIPLLINLIFEQVRQRLL